jgi:hypothetical protein
MDAAEQPTLVEPWRDGEDRWVRASPTLLNSPHPSRRQEPLASVPGGDQSSANCCFPPSPAESTQAPAVADGIGRRRLARSTPFGAFTLTLT